MNAAMIRSLAGDVARLVVALRGVVELAGASQAPEILEARALLEELDVRAAEAFARVQHPTALRFEARVAWGSWDASRYWTPNPALELSAREQFEQNQANGHECRIRPGSALERELQGAREAWPANLCGNCDSPMPEGCGGAFRDEGATCKLNETPVQLMKWPELEIGDEGRAR